MPEKSSNKDLDSRKALCSTCQGSGQIIVGYEAVCMEPVEKRRRCPSCGGRGYRYDLP